MAATGASNLRIETPRLILRTIDPARDFEGWARLMADERSVQFIGGKVMDRALAWRNMAAVIGHWQMRGFGFFSVEDKATGEWVGRVGPWYPEGWPAPEIGWSIRRDHWGKGYATEAGRASIEYAFNVTRLDRSHTRHSARQRTQHRGRRKARLDFSENATGIARRYRRGSAHLRPERARSFHLGARAAGD